MHKQIITTAILFLLFVPGIIAQKIQEKNVPDAVKASIRTAYPSAAKIKWEKEKENYEASFVKDKTDHSVVLDAGGKILERETAIPASALPAGVLAYVKEHYPGKKANELAKITDANNEVTFEVEIKGMDLIFDSRGNFIKELKD